MSRSITIHEEAVGEPREDPQGISPPTQDTVFAEVAYWKGRGYVLTARVHKVEPTGVFHYLLVTGIDHLETVLPAKRFSARKHKIVADSVVRDVLSPVVAKLKTELARRIEAGESY